MKKYEIIKNFFLGGCIGVALMEICFFIVNILSGKIDEDIIKLIKSFLTIFFFGGIIYILVVISIASLKFKDMNSKDKQKVLSKQIKLTSIVIILFSFVLLFYTVQNNMLGVIISMSFIIVFVLWNYGFFIEYAKLRKNMVMINK
jgi:L-asparagine transporter-like permease